MMHNTRNTLKLRQQFFACVLGIPVEARWFPHGHSFSNYVLSVWYCQLVWKPNYGTTTGKFLVRNFARKGGGVPLYYKFYGLINIVKSHHHSKWDNFVLIILPKTSFIVFACILKCICVPGVLLLWIYYKKSTMQSYFSQFE